VGRFFFFSSLPSFCEGAQAGAEASSHIIPPAAAGPYATRCGKISRARVGQFLPVEDPDGLSSEHAEAARTRQQTQARPRGGPLASALEGVDGHEQRSHTRTSDANGQKTGNAPQPSGCCMRRLKFIPSKKRATGARGSADTVTSGRARPSRVVPLPTSRSSHIKE